MTMHALERMLVAQRQRMEVCDTQGAEPYNTRIYLGAANNAHMKVSTSHAPVKS
jgi:hypothetical protein